ncbi:hypothetical protein jhhlp_007345, partial [Lomentospora prolificans]
ASGLESLAMFNALNRFISRLDGDAPATQHNRGGEYGFQVLRNTNLELAVEPWYDFIVGINGRPLDNPSPHLFSQEVRNCAGGTVTLGLWNAKGQRTREMHIPVPPDTASLGLSLQWTPISVAANIWHVLDVAGNSPADQAGLLPYSDYILGSPEGILHGESGLSELVEDHIARPLRLYVYNNEYDVTREVTIQPSRDWGGEGALGCVLGYGALHRLPAPLSEPVSAPGTTMFDGDTPPGGDGLFVPTTTSAPPPGPPPTGGDFLVPADITSSQPVGGPPRGKKKERHGHRNPSNLMDDYLKEEEQKSRELDRPSGRSTPLNNLPPPPKGGPPRADAKPTSPTA